MKVLSIIIYSDATTCDIFGKVLEHSVYLILGNIPIWHQNKLDIKALLTYLPMTQESNDEKKMPNFTLFRCQLFHSSMKILIEPLKLMAIGDFDLYTDNGLLWCYSFLLEILGNMPEPSA